MRITDIKGSYDAIFSLGDLCLAALQLRKNNLRPYAGPLDWMSSPSLLNVNRLLKSKFAGFMDLANLIPSGYSGGVNTKEPHLCLTDKVYQIVSSHDFKADRNTFSNLATYPEVREKLDRRIHRFLDILSTGQRILFIRTEGSFEEVLELKSVLSQLIKNDFNILLINHSNVKGMVELNWPIERVCALELPNVEKWNGNDHYWRTIFSGITIKMLMKPVNREFKSNRWLQQKKRIQQAQQTLGFRKRIQQSQSNLHFRRWIRQSQSNHQLRRRIRQSQPNLQLRRRIR